MNTHIAAGPTVALNAVVETLGALITRLESQEATLTSLHDEAVVEGDTGTAERIARKREGLRIGLADAREEFVSAVARLREAQDRAGYAALVADDTVPLVNYSVALDEIFVLRRALAYEAQRTVVDLDYKTFPKSRRAISEAAIERMRSAARGHAQHAYGSTPSRTFGYAMREAGAAETLTRAQWEASCGLTSPRSEQ